MQAVPLPLLCLMILCVIRDVLRISVLVLRFKIFKFLQYNVCTASKPQNRSAFKVAPPSLLSDQNWKLQLPQEFGDL